MASKTAILAIRIVSDAKDAGRGFDSAEKATGGFTRGLDRASVAAAGVLAGVAGMAKAAFDAASAAQQSAGAVESVFGAQAAAVKKNAAAAAQAVGLANSQYSDLAAVLGSQLKNMGVAVDDLAPKTDGLIKLGADLAATYGGTTADAVAAVSSLMRGETDPIERYGVSIKQADINARLASMGLSDLEGEAAKAAQAQAVLGLLSDQTGSALGAFGREADTAAGQQQRASAEFENAKAALGEALLPVVADGAVILGDLARVIGENADVVLPLVAGVASLSAAVLTINGALKAFQAMQAAVTAAQWLWNVAMTANPIGLIIIAVAALVAAVVLLYTKFDAVKRIIDKVARGAKAVGGFIGGLLPGAAGPPAGGGAYAAAGALYGAAGTGPSQLRAAGAVSSASPVGGGLAGLGSRVAMRAGDTINITVNGAVDRYGTASTIRGLLDERDRNLGRTTALVAGLPR